MYGPISLISQKSFYILHFRLTYKDFGYFDRENCIFFSKSFRIYKFQYPIYIKNVNLHSLRSTALGAASIYKVT